MLGRHVAAVLHGSANTQLLKPLAPTFTTRLSIRAAPVVHRRLYATPSRPKKAVGETSRPIKRTPKVTSPEAAAKKEADAKKAAEKKNALAEKKKAAAEKKKAAAAKKKATAAEKKKATAAKQKAAAAKKKAAAAEKKAVATKRKAATSETAKQQVAKREIRELKAAALSPPVSRQNVHSAYSQFVKDTFAKTASEYDGLSGKEKVVRLSKSLSEGWKNVTPAEREHYNHLAHVANDERKAAYKAWVLAHSVEDIQAANTARKSLRRRLEADLAPKHATKWPRIEDERALKTPVTAYIRFAVNRRASGDFKDIALGEASKLIGVEWQALPESEKAKYKGIADKDREQYYHDYPQVYGHEAPNHQAASAAA